MFLAKLDVVRASVLVLGQVEYQEVFGLVDNEEFAQSGHELATRIHTRFACMAAVFTEVQRTPLDLHDRVLANIVPDSDRRCEVVVEHSVQCVNR